MCCDPQVKGATVLNGKALGALTALHGALKEAVASPEHCTVSRTPNELWQHKQSMWAELRAWFDGIKESYEQAEAAAAVGDRDAFRAALGAVKALPVDLLRALSGTVCFVRMVSRSS